MQDIKSTQKTSFDVVPALLGFELNLDLINFSIIDNGGKTIHPFYSCIFL